MLPRQANRRRASFRRLPKAGPTAYGIGGRGHPTAEAAPGTTKLPARSCSGREFRETKTGSSGNYPYVGSSQNAVTCRFGCEVRRPGTRRRPDQAHPTRAAPSAQAASLRPRRSRRLPGSVIASKQRARDVMARYGSGRTGLAVAWNTANDAVLAEGDRASGRAAMAAVIDALRQGVPAVLVELRRLGWTLTSEPATCWPTSTGPAPATAPPRPRPAA